MIYDVTSTSILVGTSATLLSGRVADPISQLPVVGAVLVSIGGVSEPATVNPSTGSFIVSFPTGSLAASLKPYAITYSWNSANPPGGASSATGTLTVYDQLGGFSIKELPLSVIAGNSSTFQLVALDSHGNVDPTYQGTVQFTSTDAKAGFTLSYTFTAADAGVHTFTNGVRFVTAGIQSLTATDVSSSIHGTATTTVVAAATVGYVLTGLPSTVIAGSSLVLTLEAVDRFNNVTTGYTGTAHFTSTDQAAVLPADYTFQANDKGVRKFSGVVLKTDGVQSIVATAAGHSSIGGKEETTVTSAAASQYVITELPSPVVAGAGESFLVTVEDPYGNTAQAYTGTVHFTSSDPQAALPADYMFMTNDHGVHLFKTLNLKTAGNQSVTATDTLSQSITGSKSTLVTAAALAELTMTGMPPTTTAGTAFNLTVSAVDPYGNAVSSYRGTVHFTSTDPSAALPGDYPFTVGDAGSHTFTGVVLETDGIQGVTAVDLSHTTFKASQTTLVTPAAPAGLTMTGMPATTTAGTAFNLTVSAVDAFGNPVPSYRGTVHFVSTDSRATLPGDYQFTEGDAGNHTFTGVELETDGIEGVTAVDLSHTTFMASQTTLVTPAAPAGLTMTGMPATTTAGTAFNLTVSAVDAFGDPVPSYRGTVHFVSTDFRATLPGDYQFTEGDAGSHTFTGVVLVTAGNRLVTATDESQPHDTATESTFVTAAAPLTMAISGLPQTLTAGSPQSVTVTLADQFGNVATGFTGAVHLASTDARAALPADYTFTPGDAGTHSFAGVVLKTAGTQVVIADIVATPSISASEATLVTAAATSQLVITDLPPEVVADIMPRTMPVITAEDPFGNITPNYAGTVHFTSTDGKATLPPDTTFDGKTGSITLTCSEFVLVTAGTQSLTVADVSDPSIRASASTSVVAQPDTIEAYVSCGVLYILGDAHTDLVDFSLAPNDPGHSIVTNDGVALAGSPFDTTTYSSVVAIGGTGNMSLAIDATNGTPVPSGGVEFTGHSGNDTLVAPNQPDTWAITGADTGVLNDPVTFTNVANLTGGNQTNYFTFQQGATVSGVIRGGFGQTTLDSTNYTLSLTNDVLTSGNLTIEGQTISVGSNVIISSRDVGTGDPVTGMSLGDSGSITIQAPSDNATVSTEFAATSPSINFSSDDSVLAEVEPGSVHFAGSVSIEAKAATDSFGSIPSVIDTNLNPNAVSVAMGTGSTIMGGSITVLASAQDLDLTSELPNAYDTNITGTILNLLKQVPDLLISSLTGIAGQVTYRHANATVTLDGTTVVGNGAVSIGSDATSNASFQVVSLNGVATSGKLALAIGYGQADATAITTVDSDSQIIGANSVQITSNANTQAYTKSRTAANITNAVNSPSNVAIALAIANTNETSHVTIGQGSSVKSTGESVDVDAEGNVNNEAWATPTINQDGTTADALAFSVDNADIKTVENGAIDAKGDPANTFSPNPSNSANTAVNGVDYANSTIRINGNGFTDGQAVNYSNGGGDTSDIGGLTSTNSGNTNPYYVQVVDANDIQLANAPEHHPRHLHPPRQQCDPRANARQARPGRFQRLRR